MKILALDTSSNACSVALLSGDEIKVRHEVIPMQHAQSILVFLEEVLDSDGFSGIDALAWGCGPGSFTGLRIGASVIQAMGFARDLPIVNISSLAALAQTVHNEKGWKDVLVAVDARMNEVYWGCFRADESGFMGLINKENLTSPRGVSPQGLADKWYGAGNAWDIYRGEISVLAQRAPCDLDASSLPKAAAIAMLGQREFEKGEWVKPFDALPVYLRDNVV